MSVSSLIMQINISACKTRIPLSVTQCDVATTRGQHRRAVIASLASLRGCRLGYRVSLSDKLKIQDHPSCLLLCLSVLYITSSEFTRQAPQDLASENRRYIT